MDLSWGTIVTEKSYLCVLHKIRCMSFLYQNILRYPWVYRLCERESRISWLNCLPDIQGNTDTHSNIVSNYNIIVTYFRTNIMKIKKRWNYNCNAVCLFFFLSTRVSFKAATTSLYTTWKSFTAKLVLMTSFPNLAAQVYRKDSLLD